MAPPTILKKLTAMQTARESEIESMRARLINKPIESISKGMVQARIESIKEIWAEARKTHSDILVRDEAESDAYVADNWFDRIQGVYENALDEFLTLASRFEKVEGDTTLSEAGSEGRVAKLPRIPLPTFSGDYEDWASFCDLFTNLMHEIPRLSDATKLQYLKLCLKGSAAELIKDVTTTSANYASTWQALKARYNNPRLIINKLLHALMEIPYLKRESATQLRSFIDEAQRIIRILANLKLPVYSWDVWLVFLLSERLDSESRKLWEAELSERDRENENDEIGEEAETFRSHPRLSDLMRFLEKRAQALSMLASERRAEKRPASTSLSVPQARKIFHTSSSQGSSRQSLQCQLCDGLHSLAKCYKLKDKNPSERLSTVKRLRACLNCLGAYRVNACPSSGRCSVCQSKHHTLLHLKPLGNSHTHTHPNIQGTNNPQPPSIKSDSTAVVSAHVSEIPVSKRRIILATARVQVVSPSGESTCVRALLDHGSETSLISESIVQLLGLPKQRTCVPLSGLGASVKGTAHSMTRIALRLAVNPNFQLATDALILPRLTSKLPNESIDNCNLQLFERLDLADPQLFVSAKVDLIIGADIYGQLLRSGLRRFPPSQLTAQNTALGWIVSGSTQEVAPRRAEQLGAQTPMQVLHCASEQNSDLTLQRFWEIEELPTPSSKLKPEDEQCEQYFQQTHRRNSEGRYIVRLPTKSGLPSVGAETRQMALGSLASIHRRFARDNKVAEAYRQFMADYERLGHMIRIPNPEVERATAWYLPHHPVVQTSADAWKLRVVFDASRRTRESHFLNDFLFTGALLQGDLALILLNWRKYLFAFTADIVKMFRQIDLCPEDQNLQRIVWSPDTESEPVDYRFTMVTYGTACAPYLASRTLMQLVEDEGMKFPLGTECLKSEPYVDDTFAGADDIPTAVRKRIELSELLGAANFELDTWAANHSNLLPPQSTQGLVKQIEADKSVKTLGVRWNSGQDQFRFNLPDIEEFWTALTKRAVLSRIARLFDPLGWLSPITVSAKMLMQDLWIQKCDWDTPLPEELRERWCNYCKSLANLPSLAIDRWLGVASNRSYQLHGFSDASFRTYAAVIYLRIDHGDGQCSVSLLAAKTMVAPVKTVSIPNLELCGAALLVKLACYVRKLDFLASLSVCAWSDSQIVLTWLRRHPCHWKTFVANRVSYIQTELPSATWSHVPTKENPADLATRGLEPAALSKTSLWWHGPSWLCQGPENWPKPAEGRRVLHAQTPLMEPEILTRFSSLDRLTRVIAFCIRPLANLRRRKQGKELAPPFLTSQELSEARRIIIRLSQASSFSSEIEVLRAGGRVSNRSRLSKLNPFLCKDNILRVGGRLTHSGLSFERKHPPIFAHQSALSSLFVRFAHRLCLHGGPTLTASILMQQVWIVGRNKLVKSCIHTCVTCQRVKPQSAQQLMGDLPAERVTSSRPFSIFGLDYAGPIQIRTTKGRGHRSYKGYIVVFICFMTRAIHLELVSDVTTASFISASSIRQLSRDRAWRQ